MPKALGPIGGATASDGHERNDDVSRMQIALHVARVTVRICLFLDFCPRLRLPLKDYCGGPLFLKRPNGTSLSVQFSIIREMPVTCLRAHSNSCTCASRNQSALSKAREYAVKMSAVFASPASPTWSIAARVRFAAVA